MLDVRELSERYEPFVVRALETLWGKSRERAGGTTNLLLAHLLDTAAVAEWDGFLARATRSALMASRAGRGGDGGCSSGCAGFTTSGRRRWRISVCGPTVRKRCAGRG